MSLQITSDCLDRLLGITRTECDCFTIEETSSESGLWIDELEGLELMQINGASNCAVGTLEDLLLTAREQAVIAFKTDFEASLLSNGYKLSKQPFKSNIGRTEFTSNKPVGNYNGLRFLFAQVPTGVWKIKRIGVAFNGSGTFDLKIYNNIEAAPIHTISVTSVSGKVNWNTVDLELPMYSQDVEYLQYAFVYDNPGFECKDNRLRCCGAPNNGFSCLKPDFTFTNDARYKWVHFAQCTGFTDSTNTNLFKNISHVDNAYGLVLDSEMTCNLYEYPCQLLHNKNTATVIAYAIWFRAGKWLCDKILSSGQINKYTMLDRERLAIKRNSYAKEYQQRIDWLPDNVDLASSNCIICDSKMSMGSLLR